MTKKQTKNYTPQFDFDNIEEIKLEIETCKSCGKTGTQLGLNKDGICSNCIQIKTAKTTHKYNHTPNKELFLKYMNEKNKYGCVGTLIGYGLIWSRLHKYGMPMFFAILFILHGIVSLIFYRSLITIFISLLLILIGINLIFISKKRLQKKFNKYNTQTIIFDVDKHEWVCPCCKNIVQNDKYCDKCGILPNLILSNKVNL